MCVARKHYFITHLLKKCFTQLELSDQKSSVLLAHTHTGLRTTKTGPVSFTPAVTFTVWAEKL